MSVRVICPHCRTECLLAEKHFAVPVKCAHCGKAFTVQAPAAKTPPAIPVNTPRLDIGSATSAGRSRNRNEDCFLVQHAAWTNVDGLQEIALLAVADGMGGHEAGNEASSTVIQAIASAFAPLLNESAAGTRSGVTPDVLKEAVAAALRSANTTVQNRAKSDARYKGMGATAALALIWNGQALIGHAGDCRVYHLRSGQLMQVTRDHTLVARMLELGQLSPREAAVHPARHEVTQAVGRHTELKPDIHQLALKTGDWLILASDGLHTDLDESELRAELQRPAASASEGVRRLVDLANDRGGSDNCTVIAVQSR